MTMNMVGPADCVAISRDRTRDIIVVPTKPGTITVRASGFGLNPAEERIESVALRDPAWPS